MAYQSIAQIRLQNVERIIRDKCGGDRPRFADHVGVSHGYVRKLWVDGPNGKAVGEELARKIEAAFNMLPNWLDNCHEDVMPGASLSCYGIDIDPDGTQHLVESDETVNVPGASDRAYAIISPPGMFPWRSDSVLVVDPGAPLIAGRACAVRLADDAESFSFLEFLYSSRDAHWFLSFAEEAGRVRLLVEQVMAIDPVTMIIAP